MLGFTACGGGGGGGGDNNPAPATPPPAGAPNQPVDIAPTTVAGRTLELNSSGAIRQIRFAASGNTYDELSNGTEIQSGTYQYTKPAAGAGATLIMQENNGQVTVALTFASGTAGSFNYTQGRTGSGTFTLQSAGSGSTGGNTTGGSTGETSGGGTTGSTNGGTTGETSGGSTGGTTGGTSGGLAYSSLAGRTMLGTRTFTSTGPVGQTHVYTFTQNTFHDSDPPEESDGNYTYSATGNTASLVLNYTSPAEFQGDRHEMTLNFQEVGRGTFTSSYVRDDGTVITINGNFEFP